MKDKARFKVLDRVVVYGFSVFYGTVAQVIDEGDYYTYAIKRDGSENLCYPDTLIINGFID